MHTPVLLLAGRQDRIVPLAIARRLADTIQNASLRVLDRCGHVPQEEEPELTSTILRETLAVSHADNRTITPMSLAPEGAGPT